MSTHKATFDGWVGYTTAEGKSADMRLEAGQEFDSAEPIVVARPDLFVQVEDPEIEAEIQRQQAAPVKAAPTKAASSKIAPRSANG